VGTQIFVLNLMGVVMDYSVAIGSNLLCNCMVILRVWVL